MTLRSKLIRLAAHHPEVRSTLLPILAKQESVFEQQFLDAKKLSQVDPTIAKLIVNSGRADGGPKTDDVIKVSQKPLLASTLKPSQTTMVMAKALSMAMWMLSSGKIGGDLGAMVSSDGYIMDGHHRWAATVLAGDGTIDVWQASVNGQTLLRVLNIVSAGKFGVRNGQPGEGSINDFVPGKIAAFLQGALDGTVKHPQFSYSPDDVAAILTKAFGSPEAGVKQMAANVQKLKRKTLAGAPDRKDMPVITPEQVPAAAALLNSGQVDWNAPYKEAALRSSLIRLAHAKPELRAEILPLLAGRKQSGANDKPIKDFPVTLYFRVDSREGFYVEARHPAFKNVGHISAIPYWDDHGTDLSGYNLNGRLVDIYTVDTSRIDKRFQGEGLGKQMYKFMIANLSQRKIALVPAEWLPEYLESEQEGIPVGERGTSHSALRVWRGFSVPAYYPEWKPDSFKEFHTTRRRGWLDKVQSRPRQFVPNDWGKE